MIELKIGEAQRVTDWLDWSLQLAAIWVQVAGVIVWPLTIIALAFCFRSPITGLLAKVTRFSVAGTAFEFQQHLQNAESAAVQDDGDRLLLDHVDDAAEIATDESGASPDVAPEAPPALSPNDDLTSISPNVSVLVAWKKVEERLRQLNNEIDNRKGARNPMKSRPISVPFLILKLDQHGLLSPTLVSMLNEMRQMRNLVAHESSPSISIDEAKRFQTLAEIVLNELRQVNWDGAYITRKPS